MAPVDAALLGIAALFAFSYLLAPLLLRLGWRMIFIHGLRAGIGFSGTAAAGAALLL